MDFQDEQEYLNYKGKMAEGEAEQQAEFDCQEFEESMREVQESQHRFESALNWFLENSQPAQRMPINLHPIQEALRIAAGLRGA